VVHQLLGTPGQWEQVGGPAAQFAITNDALYGLAGDRQKIWQYTGHGKEWIQVGGPADSIMANGRDEAGIRLGGFRSMYLVRSFLT
jgi:hypothetical protein